MNEKDLEQISGGVDVSPAYQELWDAFVKSNCGGCPRSGEPGCQSAQHEIRGAIARQIALKDHPTAPQRCPHRWPI